MLLSRETLAEKRAELIERLAEVDEHIEELYLMEEEPTEEDLHTAIRKATIALQFVPVFLGSAYVRGVCRCIHTTLYGHD